jgi:hypothetical protein
MGAHEIKSGDEYVREDATYALDSNDYVSHYKTIYSLFPLFCLIILCINYHHIANTLYNLL